MIMNAKAARHLHMWKVSNVQHVSECYRFKITIETAWRNDVAGFNGTAINDCTHKGVTD
jgi:hypothetical protein